MRLQNPFAALSPSGLDSQVLLVLARSEEHLSAQQIHGLLPEGGSRTGVQKSVARFVEQGTVRERRFGNRRAYALNDEHLLAGPIRQIASSKRQLLNRMAQVIAGWPLQPIVVTLFGSAARNEMRSDSDIDLLIVMPDAADAEELELLVADLGVTVSALTGNDVQSLIYRAGEVGPAKVFESIVDQGVSVAGDAAWLRRRIRRGAAAA